MLNFKQWYQANGRFSRTLVRLKHRLNHLTIEFVNTWEMVSHLKVAEMQATELLKVM